MDSAGNIYTIIYNTYVYLHMYIYITLIIKEKSYKFERRWGGTGGVGGRSRDDVIIYFFFSSFLPFFLSDVIIF